MIKEDKCYSSESNQITRVKVNWKKTVGITLPRNLIERARKKRLNISRISEQALNSVLDYLESQNPIKSSDFLGKASFKEGLVGRPGLEPGTFCVSGIVGLLSEKKPSQEIGALLENFFDFIIVDQKRTVRTAKEKVWYIRKFLKALRKNPVEITREDIRNYLKSLKGVGRATYSNTLKSLKVFFRDFLQKPEVVTTFRFPKEVFKPKNIPTKEDLQKFCAEIDSIKEKALFLFFASSGLRRNEILKLRLQDLDLTNRTIIPAKSESETKHSWVSFYNQEAESLLEEYLHVRESSRSLRLFPFARKKERKLWRGARERTGLEITPKVLREWFCEEMGRLGVSDRYIDAFCGRTPKSVLARHYSDYSPEKLRQIYEKASLKVLS